MSGHTEAEEREEEDRHGCTSKAPAKLCFEIVTRKCSLCRPVLDDVRLIFGSNQQHRFNTDTDVHAPRTTLHQRSRNSASFLGPDDFFLCTVLPKESESESDSLILGLVFAVVFFFGFSDSSDFGVNIWCSEARVV